MTTPAETVAMPQATPTVGAGPEHPTTPGYRAWLMTMLVTVYASNFVDRTIVNILQQPIKEELQLQDWQLGLLGGTTFAVFYTFLGIYVARLAERGNRITILTICIIAWSAFTAMCASVTSFFQLLVLRVGVAVGEAGATPTSHSLISDHFEPAKRPGAIAIFATGNTLGNIFGALIGAFVGQAWGWRWAFIVAGAPGLILAAVTFFTLREPRKLATKAMAEDDVPSFGQVARLLLGKPTFRQLAIGAALMLFGSYAVIHFVTSHLMRTFDLPLRDAGLIGGVGTGLMLGAGTLIGGFGAQYLARRDRRWMIWVIALSMAIAGPLCAAAFLAGSVAVTAVCSLGLMICLGVFQGPLFSTTHSLVTPRMRATSSAVMLWTITLFGLGLGPLGLGLASDLIAANMFGGGDFVTTCQSGASLDPRCQQASAEGLRLALASISLIFAWASVHFFLAARTVRADVTD